MIDQGFCFGGLGWAFRDRPIWEDGPSSHLFSEVSGLSSFAVWLARLENPRMSEIVRTAIRLVPSEWYADSGKERDGMLSVLDEQRFEVRKLMIALRSKYPRLSPNWVQIDCEEPPVENH
jgi:hypothetical protein